MPIPVYAWTMAMSCSFSISIVTPFLGEKTE